MFRGQGWRCCYLLLMKQLLFFFKPWSEMWNNLSTILNCVENIVWSSIFALETSFFVTTVAEMCAGLSSRRIGHVKRNAELRLSFSRGVKNCRWKGFEKGKGRCGDRVEPESLPASRRGNTGSDPGEIFMNSPAPISYTCLEANCLQPSRCQTPSGCIVDRLLSRRCFSFFGSKKLQGWLL